MRGIELLAEMINGNIQTGTRYTNGGAVIEKRLYVFRERFKYMDNSVEYTNFIWSKSSLTDIWTEVEK